MSIGCHASHETKIEELRRVQNDHRPEEVLRRSQHPLEKRRSDGSSKKCEQVRRVIGSPQIREMDEVIRYSLIKNDNFCYEFL